MENQGHASHHRQLLNYASSRCMNEMPDLSWQAVWSGALGCSTAAVYSAHCLRNCSTAESLNDNNQEELHREQQRHESRREAD